MLNHLILLFLIHNLVHWNKQSFPFKKICICGSCGGSVTAEIKYRRLRNNSINTHIYYHCNRIKQYDCKEPYITEEELIKQLVEYIPHITLKPTFLMREFEDDMRRFNHLKQFVLKDTINAIELTRHNTKHMEDFVYEDNTLRGYLEHILLYGSPDERIRILNGVTSRFKLSYRRLYLL